MKDLVKNQAVSKLLLDMIDTITESSEHLLHLADGKSLSEFMLLSSDMLEMMQRIHSSFVSLTIEEPALNSAIACESVIDSLKRIIALSVKDPGKSMTKIEFELIPLLKDMYLQFYFWGCLWPDRDKINHYYESEMHSLSANHYIDEAERTGDYKYDISIVVGAFNKLEYTRECVESLLKAIPADLKTELILVNHGSTDGTKEYFESINPSKQLDIHVNGGGIAAVYRIVEGRFSVNVSNDVVLTENSISNLYRCISSDDRIAWVVPSTPNVSNYQTIAAEYNTPEEMHSFAGRNNISDPYRWEQRVRLCNPIDIMRTKAVFSSQGVGWARFQSKEVQSFPDDRVSLLFRRAGYRMILAKDTFCHHFGSATLNEETKQHKSGEGTGVAAFYSEGRRKFFEAFGVDPWGTGCCWEKELMAVLPCDQTGHVNILGINCGLGSNPLKIKETLKENMHNLDVMLYNTTDDAGYKEDLPSVSDLFCLSSCCEEFARVFSGVGFDYIVFDSGLERCPDPSGLLDDIIRRLNDNGVLAIKVTDEGLECRLADKYDILGKKVPWLIIKRDPAKGKKGDEQ